MELSILSTLRVRIVENNHLNELITYKILPYSLCTENRG